ncbi:DUF7033 domain-containing protein [Clostridium niameyense]|uniref:DUF7033 domain-containing protein n=1 Tax=Clostridium niameyense TaxID=1622073 RepID=UPI0013E9CBE4|nr:hypothetical protein [Clostridium niameyense]
MMIMINFVINSNIKNKKAIIYTIYYLTKNFNCDIKVSYEKIEDALNIYYGINSNDGIYIPIDDKWGEMSFVKYRDDLFATFNKDIKEPFSNVANKIQFNYDILFISKFLLTCEEEYKIKDRDDKNRFIAALSLRNEKVNIPFFNINSFILLEAINEFNKSIKFKDSNFEVFLTHDVDSVNSRNRYVFLHNLKSLLLNKENCFKEKSKELILDILYNRHLQINKYMEIENKRHAKSEFYFIAGEKHRLGKRYDLMDIKNEITNLKNSPNHIIGIHTNFFSYNNKEKIQNEINEIEDKAGVIVKSCRNHYLRCNNPETLNILSECRIISDSTIGYSDINGFRAGICNGYVPYDLNKNECIDIWETPLIVMDGIVMEKSIPFNQKWQEIKNNIDYAIKYNGTVSVLFHQRVILSEEYKKMYEKILDYVVEKKGKFVTSLDFEERKNNDLRKINELVSSINI